MKIDQAEQDEKRAEQDEKMMQLETEQRELIEKLSAIKEEQAKLDHEKAKKSGDHEWEDAAKLDLLKDQMLKKQKENINEQDREKMRYQELLNQKLNSDSLFHQFQNNVEQKYQQELLLDKLIQDNMEQKYQQELLNDKHIQNDIEQKYQQELLNDKLNRLSIDGHEQQQQRTYILIDPIIEDLVEENIIPPHQEDVSFELSNKTFIVNGKKQSTELLERFKKKYLKKDGDYFKFSRKNGSTSTTIHLN